MSNVNVAVRPSDRVSLDAAWELSQNVGRGGRRRPIMPSVQSQRQEMGGTIVDNPVHGRYAALTGAGDVHVKRPRFLDYPMLPLGVITVMAGRAGVSKSTLMIFRAALATLGKLKGDYEGQPVNVAFSAIEDDESLQVARLKAAGADLDHVCFIAMRDNTNGVDVTTGMSIPADLPEIRRILVEHGIKLWVIDPITSAIDGDTNKRDDVRAALDPLAALAADLGISVVGIQHFNKGGGYASDKISGSHAFRDVVRSLLLVAQDDDTHDCVVTIDKSNYTRAKGDSYSYGLMDVELADDDGETMHVGKVTEFMRTERNVNEIINRNISQTVTDDDEPRAERGEVIEWLTDYLREGPAPFKQIAKDAAEEGYTRTQLDHARRRAEHPWITTYPDPDHKGRGQRRLWALATDNPANYSPTTPIA